MAMRPRVTKRERKLHLSYELPHRIHCSLISPLIAPNGSTLILYGHQRGLRILWRGGEDEEELDPDCPYPSITQHLDVAFGTEKRPVAARLLATTSITNASAAPHILKSTAIVVASSSDGKLRLLQIPLTPPTDDTREQAVQEITTSAIELDAGASHITALPAALAVKFLAHEHQSSNALLAPSDDVDGFLLVASAGKTLNTWTIPVTQDAIVADDIDSLSKTILPSPAISISLHTSPRSSQLLLADASSAVRVYDPHASPAIRRRPGSSDSTSHVPTTASKSGKWIIAFHPPFQAPKDGSTASTAFARRKKVLDAKWILNGRCALVLLEDGEWGIWNISTPPKGQRVEEFVLHGFLANATSTKTAEPAKQRQGAARLTPSTPNTRRAKEEQLFSGAPKLSDAAPRGGMSILPYSIKAGAADESIIVWYNSNIYSIASIGRFWQQSTSGERNALYSPGLTHITDINLMNEDITSISQFVAKSAVSGIGSMNTLRDLLVSAEHRAIILQSTRPSTPSRQLFQAAERPISRDQQMLDAGTLDLDGIDNMLDSMTAPVSRKVGFASSAFSN